MSKKINLVFLGLVFSFFVSLKVANAQTASSVINYNGQPSVDVDFDGLTDQGEVQIYHTDSNNADTDGDGFGDGVEVIAGSNPLDAKSTPGSSSVAGGAGVVENFNPQPKELPIPWYISRSSGIVAFLLLYVSIFLGLTLRIPLLRKIFSPAYSMKVHCWISIQAVLFAFFHAFSLLFDKWLGLKVADLFIPLASKFQPILLSLGIFGFYLMIMLVITSYNRRLLSQKIWRAVHFTNIVLYAIVFAHALYLGTDLKNEFFRNLFILANAGLVFLMLVNAELRIAEIIARKRKQKQESINNGGVKIE